MSSPGAIPKNLPPVGNDVSGSVMSGLKQTGYIIFNKDTLTAISWFLAIGILIYLGTTSFTREDVAENGGSLLFSRSFDILVFALLLIVIVYAYYSSSEKDRENILQWVFVWTRDFLNSPWYSFIETTIFAIVFYAIVYLFRIPRSPELAPISVQIMEQKIWIVYLMLFIVAFFKYVLKIPIIDILMGDQWSNFWNGLPENSPRLFNNKEGGSGTPGSSSPSGTPGSSSGTPGSTIPQSCQVPAPPTNQEVFNIANNIYSYADASNVCAAYGATLATYDQVETAYNKGAEWCNYGWSQAQMAFFPTQKSTWLKYQATDDQKNDCGRPGVNGGYFDNPELQLGVNCYGVKPKPTDADLAAIKAYTGPNLPQTKADVERDKQLNNIRSKSNLNAFQYKKWSEY